MKRKPKTYEISLTLAEVTLLFGLTGQSVSNPQGVAGDIYDKLRRACRSEKVRIAGQRLDVCKVYADLPEALVLTHVVH